MLASVILAKALITWTPLTFYIAAAILHIIVIVVGFKLLQIDPEHNSFIGALLIAAGIGAVAYFTRNEGLVGLLITSAVIFGGLVAISAGDALKSLLLGGLCIGVYVGMALVVIPKTPLTPDSTGGFAKAYMVGLENEAIVSEGSLYEHTDKKVKKSIGSTNVPQRQPKKRR